MSKLIESLKPHFQKKDPWKKKSWEAFLKMGLPTKKWENFRYVSLKGLSDTPFDLLEKRGITLSISKRTQELEFCQSQRSRFGPIEAAPIPMNRGDGEGGKGGDADAGKNQFLSAFGYNMEGVIALSIGDAMRSYGALLQKGFATTIEKEKNPFSLLNTALYQEGLFLYVPPGKEIDFEWNFPELEEGSIHLPKLEIFLGKGASLKGNYRGVFKGTYFHNEHIQITLDEGAHAKINTHLEHSSEGFGMHTLRATLKRDAKLDLLTFSKGGKCERHDIRVDLLGEKSAVDLKGLSIVNHREEIHHLLHIHHGAPHCRSSQHYKTVLLGHARASFEGKIFVEKEAQKTEAYQLNNNLLLSPKAQAMSKPNLEILADDVRASHGATCAQPKEEELFYLRTRGLSFDQARWHLARGFCKELFDAPEIDRFLRRSDGTF